MTKLVQLSFPTTAASIGITMLFCCLFDVFIFSAKEHTLDDGVAFHQTVYFKEFQEIIPQCKSKFAKIIITYLVNQPPGQYIFVVTIGLNSRFSGCFEQEISTFQFLKRDSASSPSFCNLHPLLLSWNMREGLTVRFHKLLTLKIHSQHHLLAPF